MWSAQCNQKTQDFRSICKVNFGRTKNQRSDNQIYKFHNIMIDDHKPKTTEHTRGINLLVIIYVYV